MRPFKPSVPGYAGESAAMRGLYADVSCMTLLLGGAWQMQAARSVCRGFLHV